jgi:tRNA(Ile)-lysidine synthase
VVGTRRLNELVDAVAQRLRLPEGKATVALSGGADSGALAYLAKRSRDVAAIHVHHGLPHSDLMEGAARSIADTLGIGLEILQVVVPEGPSPEGQARRARYESLADAVPADVKVLTGHTRDDHVETIVFNLIRGTGPRGLAGIPYHRAVNIFRPMLSITRDETREIAALAGLPFVDDPMNEDPGLARNLMRRRVIPLLTELNPRFAQSVARMAKSVGSDAELLDSEAAVIAHRDVNGTVSIAVGALLAAPRPVSDRVLKRALANSGGEGGVRADRIARIWDVIEGRSDSQQLGGGVAARLRGAMVDICPATPAATVVTMALPPGVHRWGGLELVVLAHARVCSVAPLSKWAAIFPSDAALTIGPDGLVAVDGEPAWEPGVKRLPLAWYEPGTVGYLSVFANEVPGWISSH